MEALRRKDTEFGLERLEGSMGPRVWVVQPTEPPACAGRATNISLPSVFTAGGGVQVAKLPYFLRACKVTASMNETVFCQSVC